MKSYIDITLLSNADIGLYFLWEKVFQQIHIGLVEMKDIKGVVPVGIALPEYDAEKLCLGNKLRLLAETENILQKFNIDKWLKRFSDYIRLTQIRTVPDNIKSYAIYRRQQTKNNKERLARRRSKRHNVSLEQAMSDLESFEDKLIKTPFIYVESQSSEKKRFRLFIEKKIIHSSVNKGFSSYGLSAESTVPEF